MIRVEVDEVIQRPIEVVFDRLANLQAYRQWLPQSKVFLDTEQTSEGPVGRGTTFQDKTTIGIFRGEVTKFQRPTNVGFKMRLHWRGIKVMESRPEYHLTSLNGRTKVYLCAEGELFGLFKLLKPYVAMRAREERKRTVAVLKQTLEVTVNSQVELMAGD
jgi:uncharacterized protein YndB with AHSA1/START domain